MRAKRLEEDKYYLSPIYRTDYQLCTRTPRSWLARLTGVSANARTSRGPGWSKYAEPTRPRYLFEHLVQVAEIQSDAATSFASDDWRLFIYVNTLVDRVSHPYWPTAARKIYIDPAEREAVRFGYA